MQKLNLSIIVTEPLVFRIDYCLKKVCFDQCVTCCRSSTERGKSLLLLFCKDTFQHVQCHTIITKKIGRSVRVFYAYCDILGNI